MPTATIDDVARDTKTEYTQPNLNHRPLLHNDASTRGMSAMDRMRTYLRSDTYRQKQEIIDQKIKKVIDYGYDQRVKEKAVPTVSGRRFGERSFDYSHVDDEFRGVDITSEALRKGNYISRRVVEVADLPLESYLYSLDNKNSGQLPVVRDLYIAQSQEVTLSSCRVPALAVIASSLDIRDILKKKIVGWSHSHGYIHPFFSDDDKDNIMRMLGTSTLKKRIRIKDPMIRGAGYQGVEYEVRYTPAIVFNAANAQPFVAVAVEYTRRYDGQKIVHINEGGSLRVIDETNGIDMDPASIDRQILERVRYNGRTLGEIAVRSRGHVQEVSRIPAAGEAAPVPTRLEELERLCKQYQGIISRQEHVISGLRESRRKRKGYFSSLKSMYRDLEEDYRRSSRSFRLARPRRKVRDPRLSQRKRQVRLE
ncbi:MAG: hypothetical protein KKC75_08395 [Nanoarchaeota archaeon]|nr:hypothetical protein [Nanoarchaeota archaeon]MBU1004491.1 hypothetical protein [Nanoarchaeota archaeon]MBU1945661.1 hypothetical protein [Nanoarchaeota archaeon]